MNAVDHMAEELRRLPPGMLEDIIRIRDSRELKQSARANFGQVLERKGDENMAKNLDEKQRFIELRAEGYSYRRISEELGVSKPTLISWSRDLSQQIHNLRAVELEHLQASFFANKKQRLEAFGKRLEGILQELEKRDMKDVSTAQLLTIALQYGDKLKAEEAPLVLRGIETPLDFQLLEGAPITWEG